MNFYWQRKYSLSVKILEVFSQSEKQQNLIEIRKHHVELLEKEYPNELKELQELAYRTSQQMPIVYGELLFTYVSANGNEVYDFLYHNKDGKRIAVSCKLSSMEDKSYRFSAYNYSISYVADYLKDIFPLRFSHMSYEERLSSLGLSVSDLQYEISCRLVEILNTKAPEEDFMIIEKLCRERFIGRGGYFKTLKTGKLIFYPELLDSDTIKIVSGSPQIISNSSISFLVDIFDVNKLFKQRYSIKFRSKFKGGKKKSISHNKFGVPNNIAGTIQINLL